MMQNKNQFNRCFALLSAVTLMWHTSALLAGEGILDAQTYRTEKSVRMLDAKGQPFTSINLININPAINAWYLLELQWAPGTKSEWYHIENPNPAKIRVDLDPMFPQGVMVREGDTPPVQCPLWDKREGSPLETGRKVPRTYVEICAGKLFLRNPVTGRETTKEVVVDFLRRHVWGGEKITSFVKETFFKDKFALTSDLKGQEARSNPLPKREGAPPPALLQKNLSTTAVAPVELGLDLGPLNGKDIEIGTWYPVVSTPGIWLSVIEPKTIATEILNSYPERTRKLDVPESNALSYIVAFDLTYHEIGFALGTKHPSLEWSERSPVELRDPKAKGPDGFDSSEPIVRTGSINPWDASRVVATFIGGYKRAHGAFKWGELAKKNKGSHYGFIENGVVFSSLAPDLATMVVYKDGRIDMKNWTEEDNKDLSNIRHARQNGVSVVEWDAKENRSMPGAYVAKWMEGNWSGSQDSQQRTVRSGACIVKSNDRNFLLYGYFSNATANGMARIFQAYQCSYGIHLDMNALEHTYLAVYSQFGTGFMIQHLISGMNVLDRPVNGVMVPRFVGTADNRDFFFVLKR